MRLSVAIRSHWRLRSSSLLSQATRTASTFAADSSSGRSSSNAAAAANGSRSFAFGIRSVERPRQFAMASVARTKAATRHSALDDKVFSSADAMAIKAFNDATLALDREYLALRPVQRAGGRLGRVSYHEGYRQCVDRVRDQESNPRKYQALVAASLQVLKQFDSIQEFALAMPQPTAFFTHAVAAAMIVQDYDQVARLVLLYGRCSNDTEADPTIVHLATNALLMQDKPRDAWQCVLRYTGAALDDTVRTREKALAASTMSCVVEYLKTHGQISGIEELLVVLEEQHRLDSALSDYCRKLMLHAIVNDTANMTDDRVWELVEQYHRVFPVRVNVPRFEMFIDMCMTANRWELIARVLDERDTEHIPKVFQRLAVQISRHALTSSPTSTQLQVIARLPALTAIGTFAKADKAEFCGNVRRARELLEV